MRHAVGLPAENCEQGTICAIFEPAWILTDMWNTLIPIESRRYTDQDGGNLSRNDCSTQCVDTRDRMGEYLARQTMGGCVTTLDSPSDDLTIAGDAALSRLRPIADGPDQWEVLRSRTDSGSGGPVANNNNTLTWSSPSGVLGCTE
jgi:hypothetical protein